MTDDSAESSGAIGQALSAAARSDFFNWFHMTRDEAPRAIGDGRIWHGYRPSGPKFHELVTLNFETDRCDRIDRATLCLDRKCIESSIDAPFARDIACSFLIWALPAADRRLAAPLIDEIGDFRGSVVPIRHDAGLHHASIPTPDLPRFPSPAYRTFLGYQGDFDQELEAMALRFVNLNWQRRDVNVATPPGYDAETKWFWLIVRRCS